MKKFWHAFVILCFVLLFQLSCIHQRPINNKDITLSDQVIEKAVKWLVDNPATFEDGGFLEMGEEVSLFYILYKRADNEKDKRFYRERTVRIVESVRAKEDFHIEFSGEITSYLIVARCAQALDLEVVDFYKFITEEILTDEGTYPPNMTYIILNSAILKDLGYSPKFPLEHSIGQGVISRMTRENFLNPTNKSYASSMDVTNFYYDITHEIFALSVFGDKNPEEMLLAEEVEFIHRIIQEGMALYLPKKQLDILCELVICAKMMNYTDFPEFQQSLDFIVHAQHEDGSFGIIPRMKDLGRPSLYRHGVLVAVWALSI